MFRRLRLIPMLFLVLSACARVDYDDIKAVASISIDQASEPKTLVLGPLEE